MPVFRLYASETTFVTNIWLTWLLLQSVKNEAEDYMLKELSLLKWQEKAVKFASEDNAMKTEEIQKTASGLQENLTSERCDWFFSN